MRHMLLGLLQHHGARHGYALMKEIRARTGVQLSIGNVYRELARLVREGIVREDELKTYDRDVRQVINHAAEFATESPEPAPEELYTDILKV